MQCIALNNNSVSVRNVLLSVVFLAISSKIAVPLYPVPITLQMFAIYFLGLFLTPREALGAVLSWLFLGAMGFPVFASNIGGLSFGPSSGYLVGMLFGAPLIGFLRIRNVSPLISCLACYFIVHVFGCLWLSNFMAWNSVLHFGVAPFVIPEFLKITLACSLNLVLNKK